MICVKCLIAEAIAGWSICAACVLPAAITPPHVDPRRAIKQPRGGCDAPAKGGSQTSNPDSKRDMRGSTTPSPMPKYAPAPAGTYTMVTAPILPPDPRGEGVARAVAALNDRDPRLGSAKFHP